MRYKVSFEFDTDDRMNGNPALWNWCNLIGDDIEDEWTKMDMNSITVYRQVWEEAVNVD